MASTVQFSQMSSKKREAPVNREDDRLIITPLGAGNEVGRSCVYMSFKGKTVLVRLRMLCLTCLDFDFVLSTRFLILHCLLIIIIIFFGSLIVGFIRLILGWLRCLTLMKLILQLLMFSLLLSMLSFSFYFTAHSLTLVYYYHNDVGFLFDVERM